MKPTIHGIDCSTIKFSLIAAILIGVGLAMALMGSLVWVWIVIKY